MNKITKFLLGILACALFGAAVSVLSAILEWTSGITITMTPVMFGVLVFIVSLVRQLRKKAIKIS